MSILVHPFQEALVKWLKKTWEAKKGPNHCAHPGCNCSAELVQKTRIFSKGVMIMNSNIKHYPIHVSSLNVQLEGDLTIPKDASAVILFAHGSGSSRHSSRNKFVASELNKSGFATLLLDLLTAEEERAEQDTHDVRFNIILLAERLSAAVDWLSMHELTRNLAIGCFGASTGSAAALVCAAERKSRISAVVSRGGRPNLAGDILQNVVCPTLLIVGDLDQEVLQLNNLALHNMQCFKALEVVSGASHLFEEPGKLEQVAILALRWFERFCFRSPQPALKPYEMVDGMSPSLIEPLNDDLMLEGAL
jgi:pimeloyl-ACP methyl ester carboxylesterase